MSGMSRILLAGLAITMAGACGAPPRLVQVPEESYSLPHTISFPKAKQTVADEQMELFADKLISDSDVVTVRNILDWFKHGTIRGGRRHFLKRTAALVFHDRNWSGCIDVATLFAGFTRSKAMDIPTVFVHAVDANWSKRTQEERQDEHSRAHTFLELYLDGTWYLLDPTAGLLYRDYDPLNLNLPGGYLVQYKGEDMWGFGINSGKALAGAMRDFAKSHPRDSSHTDPGYRQVELNRAEALTCYAPHLAPAPGLEMDPEAVAVRCPRTGLELSVKDLLPVGPGGYVLVALYRGGGEEELARFNVSNGNPVRADGKGLGVISVPRYPHKVGKLEVRYDPGGVGGHDSHLPAVLSGIYAQPGLTELAFAAVRRMPDPVRSFTIARKDERVGGVAGIRFKDQTGVCTLELPPLTKGWNYELWLMAEVEGIPSQLSLGRFSDDQCPGAWLAPDNSALTFSGRKLTGEAEVLVTIEPDPDPTPLDPFYLAYLKGTAPAGTTAGQTIPLKTHPRPLPTGRVRAVW